MRGVALVRSDEYLRHDTGRHPENAARLRALDAYLRETGLAERLPLITPRPAIDEELLAVHSRRHLAFIERIAAQGGGRIDADTLMSAESERVARLAAGGALAALDAIIPTTRARSENASGITSESASAVAPENAPSLTRENATDFISESTPHATRPESAFVLARPPGHHAMAEQAMGFCLYNSIAVAARYAQSRHGLRRILVLDWDVHHGNGTQDIFYDDPSVLFISLHQYPLWPPGWGSADQVGSENGAGYSVNLPLPPGEGDDGYALACERVVGPIAAAFKPELVLVSAGQDGHAADPISGMALSAQGFAALARLARGIARDTGAYGPVLVLEGGYNPHTLGYLVGGILDALGDLGLQVDDPYRTRVPVSQAARDRLATVVETLRPWWRLE